MEKPLLPTEGLVRKLYRGERPVAVLVHRELGRSGEELARAEQVLGGVEDVVQESGFGELDLPETAEEEGRRP